jgi:tryptophan-rich sensory protein
LRNKAVIFTLFGAVAAWVAILGARATKTGLDGWYPSLKKPPFQPPNAAFPIAWTALYAAIAIAGSIVYLSPPSRNRSLALVAWTAQMGFNVAWSELFFRHRRPDLALVDSALLLASIASFCLLARKTDRRAFGLFIPYFAWGGFATLLNEEIVRLNGRVIQTNHVKRVDSERKPINESSYLLQSV